jgi:hypothetical protein
MNTAFVQESSVTAAEIDQPAFPEVLQVNERVTPRRFGRFENDSIRPASS